MCMVGDGLACAGYEMGGCVRGGRWVGVCWVGDGLACAG